MATDRAQGTTAKISNGIVALLKEYYGRGPEKAKSYIYDDLVVVVMRGGFTRVEETLLEAGHGDAVIQQRSSFQDVMADRFSEIIEAHTGRKVIACMSGSHQDPDLLAEIFLLNATDLVGDAADRRSNDRGIERRPSRAGP